MNFNYVCELKTANGMAGTMVFGDLLENCMRQRLLEQYNAPEYERVQLLHELSGLYSEAYENTALFFGEEPVEVRFFGVPGGDEDDFMLNAVTRLEDGRCFLFSADDDFMQSYVGKQRFHGGAVRGRMECGICCTGCWSRCRNGRHIARRD